MFMPQFSFARSAAFAVLVGLSFAAAAQTPATPPAMNNILSLQASATQEVAQDVIGIQMGTSRDGTDSVQVQAQLKTALDNALQIARAQAEPGQLDVRTGNFSLYPRYDRQGKINGWAGSAELVLEGKDFARISQVAGRIQTLSIQHVGFSLSRGARQAVEADVQARAVAAFQAKSQQLAKQFGFAGYGLREVNVSSADQYAGPRPRMMEMSKAAMSDAPLPTEAGKTSVTVMVSGSIQLR
jgi:predicted secreted protein